jgi:hypothetical protein
MPEKLCISEERVQEIIDAILMENEHYTEETILKAIKSCCEGKEAEPNFFDCVKIRTKQFHLMQYKR